MVLLNFEMKKLHMDAVANVPKSRAKRFGFFYNLKTE